VDGRRYAPHGYISIPTDGTCRSKWTWTRRRACDDVFRRSTPRWITSIHGRLEKIGSCDRDGDADPVVTSPGRCGFISCIRAHLAPSLAHGVLPPPQTVAARRTSGGGARGRWGAGTPSCRRSSTSADVRYGGRPGAARIPSRRGFLGRRVGTVHAPVPEAGGRMRSSRRRGMRPENDCRIGTSVPELLDASPDRRGGASFQRESFAAVAGPMHTGCCTSPAAMPFRPGLRSPRRASRVQHGAVRTQGACWRRRLTEVAEPRSIEVTTAGTCRSHETGIRTIWHARIAT